MGSFNKDNNSVSEFTQRYSDSEAFDKKTKQIEEIQKEISELKKMRIRELNRKTKLGNLTTELNSLNRTVDTGKVICGDCGSDNILFSNKEFNFDVSNITVRKRILGSIKEEIAIQSEAIGEHTRKINEAQEKLTKILSEIPIETRNLLLYSSQILSEKEIDSEIHQLSGDIKELTRKYEEMQNELEQARFDLREKEARE